MAQVTEYGGALRHGPDNRAARWLKIIIAVALAVCVWGYARFGTDFSPSPQFAPSESTQGLPLGPFAQPVRFVATPGGRLKRVHTRAGPSVDAPIKGYIRRGTVVVGVARAADASGNPWIELDGGLYVKETVLTPAGTNGAR